MPVDLILSNFYNLIKYGSKSEIVFGYLPQNQKFDKRFPITVTEVVLSGLMPVKSLFAKYTKEDKSRANSLLEQYGLSEYRNSAIGDLSGGQVQRVLLLTPLPHNNAL